MVMSRRDNRVSCRANRSAALALMAAAFAVLHTLPPPAHAMYDPHHGRWLQRDPARYADSMNSYQYVNSRPTFYLDWSGDQASQPAPPASQPPGSQPAPPTSPKPPASQPAPGKGGTCGADITNWLVGELNTNMQGATVSALRKHCCLTYGEVLFGAVPLQLCDCYLALRWFRDMVKPNAPWDYKSNPKGNTQFGKANGCCTGSCASTVTICGQCYNRDVPGNVNYGFTGCHGCIGISRLLKEAAKLNPDGKDSSGDIEGIKLGFRLCQKGGTVSTASLCAEFGAVGANLEKAGTEGCTLCSVPYQPKP